MNRESMESREFSAIEFLRAVGPVMFHFRLMAGQVDQAPPMMSAPDHRPAQRVVTPMIGDAARSTVWNAPHPAPPDRRAGVAREAARSGLGFLRCAVVGSV